VDATEGGRVGPATWGIKRCGTYNLLTSLQRRGEPGPNQVHRTDAQLQVYKVGGRSRSYRIEGRGGRLSSENVVVSHSRGRLRTVATGAQQGRPGASTQRVQAPIDPHVHRRNTISTTLADKVNVRTLLLYGRRVGKEHSVVGCVWHDDLLRSICEGHGSKNSVRLLQVLNSSSALNFYMRNYAVIIES